MATMPRPTAEEQSAPGYRASDWALRNGVCLYHGGAHVLVKSPVFSGQLYCRLCRELEGDLLRRSATGEIHLEAAGDD